MGVTPGQRIPSPESSCGATPLLWKVTVGGFSWLLRTVFKTLGRAMVVVEVPGDGFLSSRSNPMAEVPRVVSALSSVLVRMSQDNDTFLRRLLPSGHPASAFDSPPMLPFSVPSYLRRVFQYADCSSSCYVVAYIYLDRFLRRHPAVALHPGNVHMFLLTSVLAAVKFIDGVYCCNPEFAMVGLIDVMKLNELEINFLFGMGFEMNVTPPVFDYYCLILETELLWTTPLPRCPPPLLHLQLRRCLLEDNEAEVSAAAAAAAAATNVLKMTSLRN